MHICIYDMTNDKCSCSSNVSTPPSKHPRWMKISWREKLPQRFFTPLVRILWKYPPLIAVILTSLPRRQNTVRATGRQKLWALCPGWAENIPHTSAGSSLCSNCHSTPCLLGDDHHLNIISSSKNTSLYPSLYMSKTHWTEPSRHNTGNIQGARSDPSPWHTPNNNIFK